jgi:hypothetical protein
MNLVRSWPPSCFGVPTVWFSPIKAEDPQKAIPRLGGRYRVATVEDRVNYIINAFCMLDLEREQHLLAIAGALAHQEL